MTSGRISRYDANGNGQWSDSEFTAYEANFKSEAIFDMVDTSAGGAISAAEFAVFYRAGSTFADYGMKENGAMTQTNWEKYTTDYGIPETCTFSSVDTSGNKLVSKSEYYASFYNAGCRPSAKARFVQYDTDANGQWSADEFEAYSKNFKGCGTPTDTPKSWQYRTWRSGCVRRVQMCTWVQTLTSNIVLVKTAGNSTKSTIYHYPCRL